MLKDPRFIDQIKLSGKITMFIICTETFISVVKDCEDIDKTYTHC